MIGRILPLTTLVFLACLASASAEDKKKAAAPPSTAGPSSVWVVEKDGHKLYIGGTIHLLRAEDYPLPDVFEEAYKDSKTLVFELPPGSEGDGEVVLRMQQMGTYPEGDDLGQHVSGETLKKVNTWADKNAFPRVLVLRMRPWLLALTVATTEYKKFGANAEHGVDQHFEQRGEKDGKGGEGLETVEFQLSIFSRLNDKLQEELLMQTFSEAETVKEDFAALITAWRTGDAAKLQEFLFRDAEKYPELMEDFLLKRNKDWVVPLLKYLEKDETVFVLVGAGHLGGKGGVLELLEEKGCKVTQLGTPSPK
ncbi:hypothetical protein AYO49_02855 [Verrucomicrobiaceae bacterium SCGC AG-212-N21]|nr:hypothetical protein AYO49_02855 [Verrucomicrobiaceae bacterium SCGC AG-212-N21]